MSSLNDKGPLITLETALPHGASKASELMEGAHGSMSRRHFLKGAAAMVAALQMAGCMRRSERIVPYVNMPERLIPGRPQYYATTLTRLGIGRGVLVESHEGRPTRIEGNPKHPESRGSIDLISQAEIVSLYDDDRSRQALEAGTEKGTAEIKQTLLALAKELALSRGEGFWILIDPSTSPSFSAMLQRFKERYGAAQFVSFAPFSRDGVYEGTRLAFGQPLNPILRIKEADVIVSFGADFLYEMPGSLAYASDFISGRSGPKDDKPNRLFVFESTFTLTGARADERLALSPNELLNSAIHFAKELGAINQQSPSPGIGSESLSFVRRAAQAVKEAGPRVLIVAGQYESPVLQALCHTINKKLGSQAAVFTEPVEIQVEPLQSLMTAISQNQVQTLLILKSNPAYSLLPSSGLELTRIRNKIHCSLYRNETSGQCNLHIPVTHELEEWGDARAYDGTVSFVQPLIKPLFDGLSSSEIVSLLLGEDLDGYALLNRFWKQRVRTPDYDMWFKASLQDGVTNEAALPELNPQIGPDKVFEIASKLAEERRVEGFSVIVRPDFSIWDGRYANNSWLQEMPKPFTSLTWGNALLVAPALAEKLNLHNGSLVQVVKDQVDLRVPVLKLEGLPPDTVTMHYGYGRKAGGKVLQDVGVSASPLIQSLPPWASKHLAGIKILPQGGIETLALAQLHQNMEGRDLARMTTFQDAKRARSEVPGQTLEQHLTAKEEHEELTFFSFAPDYKYQWGMSINLNACIGCNACTMACQAENNVPTVGKGEVLRHRQMHWLRIDNYFEKDGGKLKVLFQPIPCMHCETAPCEIVCPVAATMHSGDGLNEMIYNRCVGTRYCSNNCPYKVRRFNFFQYTATITPLLAMFQNPDVTVRSRGVMEKCTYCVQRIEQVRINAEKERRSIRDGEVKTACQQACPTQAIVFGNIADPESAISKVKKDPLDYGMLTELNTRPRTTYLPRLTEES